VSESNRLTSLLLGVELASVSALAHHPTFVPHDASKAFAPKAVVTEFHKGSYTTDLPA
jgi:hypothetical protein